MQKQVIIMRADLGMSPGKLIAQGSHASLNAVLSQAQKFTHNDDPDIEVIAIPYTPALKEWVEGDFTKVCLAVHSEEELKEIFDRATDSADYPAAMVKDLGKTEFNGVPTLTCCAIGPASSALINEITGHLKLF
jgi:PTH2 family peptidyl-tRNA hydrolase